VEGASEGWGILSPEKVVEPPDSHPLVLFPSFSARLAPTKAQAAMPMNYHDFQVN